MSEVPAITVTDPDDIRAKLPALEAAIAQRRLEVEVMDRFASTLARSVGVKRKRPARSRALPTTPDRVTALIEARGRPTTIDEASAELRGVPRNTVLWALWKAAEEGQIRRVGRGKYGPLETP